MNISIYDGCDDCYWWILCAEKYFVANKIPEEKKLASIVPLLRGRALQWWFVWSQRYSFPSWDAFTTAIIWYFKPEFRDAIPELDEEGKPYSEFLNYVFTESDLESMKPLDKTCFHQDFIGEPVHQELPEIALNPLPNLKQQQIQSPNFRASLLFSHFKHTGFNGDVNSLKDDLEEESPDQPNMYEIQPLFFSEVSDLGRKQTESPQESPPAKISDQTPVPPPPLKPPDIILSHSPEPSFVNNTHPPDFNSSSLNRVEVAFNDREFHRDGNFAIPCKQPDSPLLRVYNVGNFFYTKHIGSILKQLLPILELVTLSNHFQQSLFLHRLQLPASTPPMPQLLPKPPDQIVATYPNRATIGVAHNGYLVNYHTLRAKLEEKGLIFNTTSDTEIVLHLITTSKHRAFILSIVDACEKFEGAYSIVFVIEDNFVAVRDAFGFRPVVVERRSNGVVVFAFETCVIDLIGVTYESSAYEMEKACLWLTSKIMIFSQTMHDFLPVSFGDIKNA